MRWIGGTSSPADIIAYNLRNDGSEVTVFADAQPARVEKAREIIDHLVEIEGGRTLRILELGCSAGDISGYFSGRHEVLGVDVVPAAIRVARDRYPMMQLHLGSVEEFERQKFDDEDRWDVIVLCEILEHVADPVGLVQTWLPRTKYAVIGHPLVGDGSDPEQGHYWAYTDEDYGNWYAMGGMALQQAWRFQMGGYQMVIGWGSRG